VTAAPWQQAGASVGIQEPRLLEAGLSNGFFRNCENQEAIMKPAQMLTGLVGVAAMALAASPAPAKPSAGQEPVMRVFSGSIIYTRKPGSVLICARGRVGTTGWTNAMLTPRVYVMPPANGIWEVDFTARPPRGIVPQVVTPIAASRSWAAPRSLRGIRIVSRTNSIVVRAPSRRSAC
jgi:hypothetical protein